MYFLKFLLVAHRKCVNIELLLVDLHYFVNLGEYLLCYLSIFGVHKPNLVEDLESALGFHELFRISEEVLDDVVGEA